MPNLYDFVANSPPNNLDALGLMTVGFLGAEAWGGNFDEGNVTVQEIATAVGAPPPYRSTDIMDAYNKVINHFQNCNCPTEVIKISGYSWGGASAVKLSRWLGRSSLRNHEIDVYVVDPVVSGRGWGTSVPSTVTTFWNRYETAGQGVSIPVYGTVHGQALTSHAKNPADQKDLNPGPADNGIDHFSIIKR